MQGFTHIKMKKVFMTIMVINTETARPGQTKDPPSLIPSL